METIVTETKKTGIKFSYMMLIIIGIYCFVFTDFWKAWREPDAPFIYDVDQYYSYLPAAFVHHDLTFNYPGSGRYWLIPSPHGKPVPKGTCGMAIMYAPFYFLGEKLSFNAKEQLDGYSLGYKEAIHYGGIVYSLLGLLFLNFVLLRYFTDLVSAITLGLLFFGTNLYVYVIGCNEMPHAYLFCLISAFLWLVIKWNENQKLRFSVWMGLVLGLVTLIRPSELVVFVLFLFYGINRVRDIRSRPAFLWRQKKHLLVMVAAAFCVLLPQLIYWKSMTGDFFFFSYGDQERFFFNDPKIMEVLFSYRKGWFLYTPLMLFAVAGLFMCRKKLPENHLSFILYMLVNIYLVASWWCWWFGGSFGMRALIQSYPVMALGLAAFISRLISFTPSFKAIELSVKYISVCVFAFIVCLNLQQSYQYKEGLIHYDGMNRKAYWLSFGKFSLQGAESGEYWRSLTVIDYKAAQQGKRNE